MENNIREGWNVERRARRREEERERERGREREREREGEEHGPQSEQIVPWAPIGTIWIAP